METITTIRPELLVMSALQMKVLMPYLITIGLATLAIIFSVSKRVSPKYLVYFTTLIACGAGMVSSYGLIPEATVQLFNGMMISDAYSNFFNIIFLASAAVTILISFRYLDREEIQHPEYYVLLLFSAIGMMLMVSSLDLIMLFISLEIMSLAVYTLVGFRRSDRKSNEASIKYFILGGLASAILLYGVALLYGATSSTNLMMIIQAAQSVDGNVSPLYSVGALLVFCGFMFKIASVPFHMWMPDVYEGAPAPITGFMTTGLKVASFAAFLRVFVALGYGRGLSEFLQSHMYSLLWIMAVMTMAIGNLVALPQMNLKRMLAYSSIAHTGYLLLGIIAGVANAEGYAPVALYLVTYSVMNIGAFAILTILSSRGDQGLTVQDMAGLSQRRPLLAAALAIFMLSMAGVPPTAGFIAKYYIFYGAVQSGEILLVLLAAATSVISVYYYLRVIVFMYMKDPVGVDGKDPTSFSAGLAVATMVLITLQVGILPQTLLEAARQAMTSL